MAKLEITIGETLKRLGVGRTKYKRYIEQGILPAPIRLCAGAHPFHTESQIQIAINNLERIALRNLIPASGAAKMKPLSKKLVSEIS